MLCVEILCWLVVTAALAPSNSKFKFSQIFPHHHVNMMVMIFPGLPIATSSWDRFQFHPSVVTSEGSCRKDLSSRFGEKSTNDGAKTNCCRQGAEILVFILQQTINSFIIIVVIIIGFVVDNQTIVGE